MNTISKWATVLVLFSGAAYTQVPSTNDTSDGFDNTGMGTNALIHVTPVDTIGFGNTAAGYNALFANKIGSRNAAFGIDALSSNTEGSDNTAIGTATLLRNKTGSQNVAIGEGALAFNSTGNGNTANGYDALYSNTTGIENTATGYAALGSNLASTDNTATGYAALFINQTGGDNTATGSQALNHNTIGSWNTATGFRALYSNSEGNNNTALGIAALKYNTTGSNNIALGFEAGSTLTTGSNNIDIGNRGTSSDNNMIKIGREGTQAKTFIAGIYNTSVTGSAVMVNASGQLGVVVSSERFKTAIAPMGTNTTKLEQLRPVTFKLKTDAKGTTQYGLIAEEVAKVYPELVIRDEQGRIDGVRYDELAPMLLNELQKQQQTIAVQAAQLRDMQQQLAEIRATLVKQPNKDQLVAQR